MRCLSQKNVGFGLNKAKELRDPFRGIQVDSGNLSANKDEQYDHVLCMGPMLKQTDLI